MIRHTATLTAILVTALLLPLAAWSCFGTELRIGIGDAKTDTAAYATGYYVEEKTGISPDFRPAGDDPETALKDETIDIFLAPASLPVPEGLVTREIGEVNGAGTLVYWIRPDVLEDLRFTTVDRALGRIPAFFNSSSYHEAAKATDAPKKAARKAVLYAD